MIEGSFTKLEANKFLAGIDVFLSVGLIGLFLSIFSSSVPWQAELGIAYMLLCLGWRLWRSWQTWRAEINEGVKWVLKKKCDEKGKLGAVSFLAVDGESIS